MLYYLSILIVVGSNVFYHLASKKVPENTNPFFFVMVSYVVGFLLALVAFAFTIEDKSFSKAVVDQTRLINWTPIVLGVSVIGLEVGNILMYRAGWQISQGALVTNAMLAVVLLVIGVLVFKEEFTIKHVMGLISCGLGLYLLV